MSDESEVYVPAEQIAAILINLVLQLIGHDKASEMLLTQDAINRANAEADAVERARGLT